MSAQPDTLYYKWQLEVQLTNFIEVGIPKNNIHVLIGYKGSDVDPIFDDLVKMFKDFANFFFYKDDRISSCYVPSVRPNILKKHFEAFKYLENERIFYHDSDIIFREKIDEALFYNETWYVSDASSYIGVRSLIETNRMIFYEMCDILNVNPKAIEAKQESCGGAQYILKSVNYEFWNKVEVNCEKLYIHFIENSYRYSEIFCEETKRKKDQYKEVLYWCTDMWVVLWLALELNYNVEIHSELNFCWPKDEILTWNKYKILHNAGLTTQDSATLFFKGDYINSSPYSVSLDYVERRYCSFKYKEAIESFKKFRRLSLQDVTFLFTVRIDSLERSRNLYTSIRFITKNISTNIIVLEAGSTQKIDKKLLPEDGKYIFISDSNHDFHRTKYNNYAIKKCRTEIIVIYDADIIVDPKQILEAVQIVRNGGNICLPYDGTVYGISSKKQLKMFSDKLDINLLNCSVTQMHPSTEKAVGGIVVLNRKNYIAVGMDNEKIHKWGPEDLERVKRLESIGYECERITGHIFHLYHPTGDNSKYKDRSEQIGLLNEYIESVNLV